MNTIQEQQKLLVIAPTHELNNIDWREPHTKDPLIKVNLFPFTNTDQWLNETKLYLSNHCYRKYLAALVLLPKKMLYGPDTIAQFITSGADDVISLGDKNIAQLFNETKCYLTQIINDIKFLETGCGLIGHSTVMQRFRKQLAFAARNSESNVLLLGETGTGKCLAAHALHNLDKIRQNHTFHAVDCGAITDTLLGSELFGHIAGAFTGAQSKRYGAFKTAGKGTLFLDEIGELSLSLQSSFLSALQERKYRPVGSDSENTIDCKIIAATNQNLPKMVEQEKFRADLFYRLDGMRIFLPSLNEHREDIPELLTVFLNKNNSNQDVPYEIDKDVLDVLMEAEYPGNVRLLENMARGFKNLCSGRRIRLTHLSMELLQPKKTLSEKSDFDKFYNMLECGLNWDEMQERLRQQAAQYSLQIARKKNPSATRTEQVKLAARRLNVSTRSIYDWTR